VMVCVPTASEEVLKVPLPFASSALVPSDVAPSRKVTVPVGMAVPEAAVTVAAKTTLAPVTAVVGDAASAVVVTTAAAALTVTVATEEVLPVKLTSPP
jgi:hypothetical protein